MNCRRRDSSKAGTESKTRRLRKRAIHEETLRNTRRNWMNRIDRTNGKVFLPNSQRGRSFCRETSCSASFNIGCDLVKMLSNHKKHKRHKTNYLTSSVEVPKLIRMASRRPDAHRAGRRPSAGSGHTKPSCLGRFSSFCSFCVFCASCGYSQVPGEPLPTPSWITPCVLFF